VLVLRLSDAKLLRELDADFRGLPALDYHRRHAAMASWVVGARDLLTRRDAHREALDRLKRGGQVPATGWAGEEHLPTIVAGLDAPEGPASRLPQVETWLRRSPSVEEIASRWDEEIATASDRPGLTIARQEDLCPLGRNPASGLWEFVDLRSGLLPPTAESGGPAIDEATGLIFVLLPGGPSIMGSPVQEEGRKDDGQETEHEVELGPMLISKYEVTQAQWERATGSNNSWFRGPLRPVDSVSWLAACEFCEKPGYRLPTEAEWEYASRGGSRGPFGLNEPLDVQGWYKENSGDATHPVGRKKPNRYGLYDVHGNVLEWCRDVFDPHFFAKAQARGRDPVNDPSGAQGAMRVLRGGPFNGQASYCRCADRWRERPDFLQNNHGLRPVFPIR
jgi:formylglycine-generating enzyme required for sulfatase activity